jgi:outer membrane immunogenic protein
MRAFLPTAAAAALFTLPMAAHAQDASGSKFYGGLGYSHHDYKGADPGSIQARVGARLHPNFAIEAEGGVGVNSDDSSRGGVDTKSRILREGAVYGVGLVPVSPNTDLYARVGYGATKVKTEFNAAGVTGSDKDTIKSWNYGVGGQHFFDGANGVRADYTREDASRGRDANVWSLGYVRKF